MKLLPTRLAAAALVSACWLPAQAGNLVANASQNLSPPVSNTSPGSSVSAQFLVLNQVVAESSVTRQSIQAMADGSGVLVQQARAASGDARTDYQVLDLGTNAQLVDAAGLRLSFDFRVSGVSALPPLSLSTVSVSYEAALFTAIVATAGAQLSAAYGPIAPFPSEGYIINGDSGLLGSFDRSFSLEHQNRSNGLLTMGFAVGASNAGDATGLLELTGVRWLAGPMPVAGLAVRLETGELVAVTPVPEATPATMLLAGLMAVGLMARRHRRSRDQG
jgi:hypothetical protein